MNFIQLKTSAEVATWIEWHNAHLEEPLVIDVETTDLNPRKARLVDMQISGPEQDTVFIFDGAFAGHLLSLDSRKVLVAHNYPYDAQILYRAGIDLLNRKWEDTLILGHLADENRPSHSLDAYVQDYWYDTYKQEFWDRNSNYHEAPEAERTDYACRDIYYTRKLHTLLKKDLGVQGIPDSLIRLSHELQRHLLKTQIQGLDVDLPYLTRKGVEIQTQIDAMRPVMRGLVEQDVSVWEMEQYLAKLSSYKTDRGRDACKRGDFEFSFDSPKQLVWLLYTQLGLPLQVGEITKNPSSDDASLEKIKELHPLISLVQKYRSLQKVMSSYIEGTTELLEGGRIYPEFRVTGTVTGRISHAKPNLGNVPAEGGIRGMYVPPKGCVFLGRDYSQLEVVIEANETKDPNTIRMLTEGLSKHDITAANLAIPRSSAKTLNFAMGYHCTYFKVAKILGVPIPQAQKIYAKYWDTYAGCRDLKSVTDSAIDRGEHIVTRLGRRRRFAPKKRTSFDGDYRQGYNFIIQGTGSDITSQAFVEISAKIAEMGWGPGLGFTIHDEVLVAIYRQYAEVCDKFMEETMAKVGRDAGLDIPLSSQGTGPMNRWED